MSDRVHEQAPEPTFSAVYFKQVSDDLWMYHDGSRRPFAAAPTHLGASELEALNETIASINRSLVLAGPLAPEALQVASEWNECTEFDTRNLINPLGGRIETFNRDTAGEWIREIRVGFSFRASDNLLTTEYLIERKGMECDQEASLRAFACLSNIEENKYIGEATDRRALTSKEEFVFLETVAKMGRLAIAGLVSDETSRGRLG